MYEGGSDGRVPEIAERSGGVRRVPLSVCRVRVDGPRSGFRKITHWEWMPGVVVDVSCVSSSSDSSASMESSESEEVVR